MEETKKTWEELCERVRNAPFGYTYYSPESMIKHCEEIGEKHEGEVGHDGEPCTKVKEGHLEFCIWEHEITDVFQVGAVTVKLVGKEREEIKTKYVGEVDGKPKYERLPWNGKSKGEFYMYRTESVEAIDAFRIDNTGTLHPIDERKYCSRDEIIETAQRHSDIMTRKSEDVVVNFPTGELEIANYFCGDRDNGFDELPKDIKYKSEFSINNALGREGTAQWLADNRNMAYAQLGNTSCSVWKVSEDKLVVTSAFAYTEVLEQQEGDDEPYWYEKAIPTPEGWEFVGEISCGVWRVELVDRQAMTDFGFDLEKYKAEETHKDFCSVKVNAGDWKMKCYYQQRSDKELMDEFGYPVWAELERI
jgi:hypothetical protein